MRVNPGDPPRVLIKGWFEPELATRFAAFARRNDRAMAAELRRAVRDYLDRYDRETATMTEMPTVVNVDNTTLRPLDVNGWPIFGRVDGA